MNVLEQVKAWFTHGKKPEHLRRGELGERAAKKFLQRRGLKFLTANFRSTRGEIDLIFREDDCLAFVEVKTRSSEDWTRPAAAVNARKRRLLSQTALDYLLFTCQSLGNTSFGGHHITRGETDAKRQSRLQRVFSRVASR